MLRFSLASLVLATVSFASFPAAYSKTCIRDLAGQIVCGELVETLNEPSDHVDARPDDGRDLMPEPPRAAVPQHSPYRDRRYIETDPNARIFSGNIVRPTVGANGTVSCMNHNYTWLDGACRRKGSRW
jgi:hypothetical protein